MGKHTSKHKKRKPPEAIVRRKPTRASVADENKRKPTNENVATVVAVLALVLAALQCVDDWRSLKTKILCLVCSGFGAWAWAEHRRAKAKTITEAFRLPTVVFSIVLVVIGYWIFAPAADEDLILPSNEARPSMPEGRTQPPDDSVCVFSGGGYYATSQPFPIRILTYGDKILLHLSRTNSGALLSGQFFGANGEIVAVLEDNKFTLNKENLFRVKRDKHSMVIYDKYNEEVLNLRFLNSKTFTFTGKFWLPDGRVAEFTKTDLGIGNFRISNSTSINSYSFWAIAPR